MATGFKELVLVPALSKQGLSVLKARDVIDAVLESIKDALGRHESVELPIGNFTVVENPEERAWKFGTVVLFDKYRVDFLPSDELNLAAAAASPSPPPPKRKKRRKKRVGSELTIAAELIVEFIRKNVAADKWGQFFHELRASSSIQAVFERNKPKLHELRPLDEALIDECAPEEMPENPWDHLKVCLEWFARWTQRVIPVAVYSEAMQQAKKTLAPQDLFLTLDGR